jgi:glutaredoxin
MKDLIVYGRTNPVCSSCESLKVLLKEKGIDYEYKDISTPEMFEEFSKHRLRSIPAVFSEGEYVGGFDKMQELL